MKSRGLLSVLAFVAAALLSLAGCSSGRGASDQDCSAGPAGDGSAGKPYLICTAGGLNAVRGGVSGYEDWGLDKHYVLMQDIDLSGYTAGAGWEPIGTLADPFTGSFDGNGKAISGLTINRPGSDYQGLFGSAGTAAEIKNVALLSVSVNGGAQTGGLVGENRGTIVSSSATGTVSGVQYIGGLIGENRGTIVSSSATGTVSGGNRVGGLVGVNNVGTISDSHAEGAVSGSALIGGLVGFSNNATISNSYATGAVSGSSYVGGLIGHLYGYIGGGTSYTYATGAVSGISYLGGLVGFTDGTSTISNSYATGTVSGTGSYTGGLVGANSGPISDSYATGAASGGDYTGGLVGYNFGSISTSYSAGTVSGGNYTGGLVGLHNGSLIISSYWITDNTNSLDLLGVGGSGSADGNSNILSDADGKLQIKFINWDFTDTWRIEEGVSYPELQWQP